MRLPSVVRPSQLPIWIRQRLEATYKNVLLKKTGSFVHLADIQWPGRVLDIKDKRQGFPP
jgi:hypothetical protein